MPFVTAEKFLLWKDKQISKGGDNQSLCLLVDSIGGLTTEQINLVKLNQEKNVNLNINLDLLESIWEKHLNTSIPIQYLSGIAYWRDLKLEVSDKVLIPRPETELIVEIVSEIYKNQDQKITFADLGTGSGAISIALALAYPLWDGIAIDIDNDALDIAARNFANYSNKTNVKFYCGNWWDPIKSLKRKIDLAIANPPYVPYSTYQELPKEVINYEPKIALLGGEDGLDHIKEIIKNAPLYLKQKGYLLVENHFDQGNKVEKIFLENGFRSVKVLKDLSGIGRFTIGRYK